METSDVLSRVAVLRHCPVFSTLPAATLQFLAEIMRRQKFSKGEVICEQGEPAREVFILERGEMSVRNAETGEQVGRLDAYDLFGEFGMFGRGVRLRTVVAEADCSVLSLDYDRFRLFLLSSAESALRLLEVAIGRLFEGPGGDAP